LAVSGCERTEIPKIRQCIQLTDTMFCINTALGEDDPAREMEFSLDETRGYQCTTNSDKLVMEKFILDTVEKLEVTARRLRRCERKWRP
jgi:hypothetical protein